MGVFVAALRFAGDTVDVRQPADPAPGQHRVHGRGRYSEPPADLRPSQPLAPTHVHDPAHHRRYGLVGRLRA